jgi:hypothetical protein
MEPASFTIEFPEHVRPEKQKYCLDLLSNTGALVERHSDRVFLVVCSKPRELADVGWTLFHTLLSDVCRVTSTSGRAEARASAYPMPPKRHRGLP